MQLPSMSQRRICLQSVAPSGALPGIGGGGSEGATTGLDTGGGGGMMSSVISQTAPFSQSSPDASHSHSHLHSAQIPTGQIMAQRMNATRIFIDSRIFISLPPRSGPFGSFRSCCLRQIATRMPLPPDSIHEFSGSLIAYINQLVIAGMPSAGPVSFHASLPHLRLSN